MKKVFSLILILLACCSSVLFLGGCETSNGEIEISSKSWLVNVACYEMDTQSEIEVAEDRELKKIDGVVVKDHKGNVLFEGNLYEAKINGASITGFSLKKEGTKTATIGMYGISKEFTYNVTITHLDKDPANNVCDECGKIILE